MQSWVFYGKLHKFQRAHKGSRFQGLWFRVQGFGIYLVLRNVEVNEALVGVRSGFGVLGFCWA